MTLQPAKVLLIGAPGLRVVSEPVTQVSDPALLADVERLHATLGAFRAQRGFGRAIAAPQIGVAKRVIAVNLGQGPFTVINPEITWQSPEVFTMWDDCMSFPFLLVRVRRHLSISLRYADEKGLCREWERLDQATAELMQHEMDHLDGVLAVDRAIDREALVSREVFEAHPDFFRAQVEYVSGG